jgi:RHS repeat-associated protein
MLYDNVDRLSVAIDPEARRVRKVYDLAGQLLQEIRADASPLQQIYAERSYTPSGKEMWIRDARGNQTTYAYDEFDRLKRTTFPDATYEEHAYDAMGNVVSKLTRGGQLIQNTYDTLDRMVTHLVPQPSGSPAILTSTTYDLAGRTTQISDNAGHILAYAVDTAKRPLSVTQTAPGVAGTRVVSYQLDPAGNRTRATWADGYYVQYQFDALGRMTMANENGTFVLATYIYDPLSRRTSLVYGNGASKSYTYTTQGDLTSLGHALTGTSATYTNTFTKAHQLASENVSNAAWAYLPSAFQTTAYSSANVLNQYVNITVGANPVVTLAYDANGSLTGDGTWTFAYDAHNVLRTAMKAGTSATYEYDPLGRRQAKTVNAVLTTFLSDGDEEIAEYDGANTLLRRYVPGPGTDMPIAMVTPSGGANTRRYFHTNRQGSVVAMSADSGTIAEGPHAYDAYGNGAPATGAPFKYTGRRLDPETGLYYYRARYYSPTMGRFLQVDPVGMTPDLNLYAYAGNDSANHSDPSGLARVCTQAPGSRMRTACVSVDADNDGDALDNDLKPDQLRTLARSFQTFIQRHDGQDISKSGAQVWGPDGDQKNFIRAVSQFVGHAMGGWAGTQINIVSTNMLQRILPNAGISRQTRGYYQKEGKENMIYVNRDVSSTFNHAGNAARTLLHEQLHRPEAWGPSLSRRDHRRLDANARSLLRAHGLADDGCEAIGGFMGFFPSYPAC